MRSRILAVPVVAGALCAVALGGPCLAAAPKPVPDPLPEEQVGATVLPPSDGQRVYVTDIDFNHMVDGRLHILDGTTGKYLGMLGTGSNGPTNVVSQDGTKIYTASSYYERLTRGKRTDLLEIHDARTLALTDEIPIPAKRADAMPYRGMLALSADGRFAYIQNATPASSVSVVDLAEKKFVTEIPLPGCWTIHAWSTQRRFSTPCGDGTLLTVSIDEAGNPAAQVRSAPFFDADADPIFAQPSDSGTMRYFVSFLGKVYGVHLDGDAPTIDAPWSAVTPAEARQEWRPGGAQVTALHRDSGTLFINMHDHGFDGSHKNPAKEVWAFDLATHKRLARIPSEGSTSLEASQGASAALYLLSSDKALVDVRRIGPGYALLRRIKGVGDTPILMETH